MANFNRVVLIGNLTRDPEYRQLASGQAVCRLGLALNRQFKNKQTGSMVQEVCYIDIDVWGPQAESCNQYLQKGRPVLVEGRLKQDTWEDAQGQNRNKHSVVADRVVFLGAGNATDSLGDEQQQRQQAPANELEKELMDQIEAVKSRAKKSKAAAGAVKDADNAKKETASKDEVAFKDEPPFQDELPF